MELKTWIKQSREAAQLTQTELGEAVGVGKQNVSHWENGRHEPSFTQMVKISKVTKAKLPVDPEDLPSSASADWRAIAKDLAALWDKSTKSQIYAEFFLEVDRLCGRGLAASAGGASSTAPNDRDKRTEGKHSD